MSSTASVSGPARRPEPGADPAATLRSTTRVARPAIAAGVARAKLPPAVELLAKRPDASQLGRRLDAFLEASHPTFSVDGESVRVPLHFTSLYGDGGRRMTLALAEIKTLLGPQRFAQLATDVTSALSTRGQPAQIQRTVQALIDAGALARYPGVEPQAAVRKLMFELRIGLDCMGYTLAAAQYARGVGDKSAPASSLGVTDRFRFNFAQALARVSPSSTQPGDVLHLPVEDGMREHNVVVRANQVVRVAPGETVTAAKREVPASFVAAARELRVFTVDSSWGGGARGDFGGAERRTWVFNPETQRWGSWTATGRFEQGPAPGGHSMLVALRPAGER
ncbi:MAG: hypothetical protein KF718_31540 [Polyangiaceae bacterium]|nr:hypothetical protein [Polyangiaceae bacterium]